jgi:hypothetical protein
VELGGAIELHAAFREESRTSLPSVSGALQEIRETRIFLWSLVVPSNCMRLSAKKAAHHCPR